MTTSDDEHATEAPAAAAKDGVPADDLGLAEPPSTRRWIDRAA